MSEPPSTPAPGPSAGSQSYAKTAALPLGRAIGASELPPEQDGYVLFDNCYAIDKARRLLGYAPRYSAIEAATALAEGYLAERERVRARSVAY